MDQAVELAKQSDSTIIIFVVVIAVIFIAMIPMINMLAKVQERKRQQYYDRESQLIKVIQSNTEVNSALKTLIETDQKHCSECKTEQMMMFRDLQNDNSQIKDKLTEIHGVVKNHSPSTQTSQC